MIKLTLLSLALAGVFAASSSSAALASDPTEQAVQNFACAGFDANLSPFNFDFARSSTRDIETLGFANGQSIRFLNNVQEIEQIAPAENYEKEEFFVIAGDQKYRMTIEESSDEGLTLLIRGTHPSDDPTFVAMANCIVADPVQTATQMVKIEQVSRADRERGRMIRVSREISFSCQIVGSLTKNALVTLTPDRRNSFADKAQMVLDGKPFNGSASVMGESLDGVQAFRSIISFEKDILTFTTNGDTGWLRLSPKMAGNHETRFGVCRNSQLNNEKSEQ